MNDFIRALLDFVLALLRPSGPSAPRGTTPKPAPAPQPPPNAGPTVPGAQSAPAPAPSATPSPAPKPAGPSLPVKAPTQMIGLGCVDSAVSSGSCSAYLKRVGKVTGLEIEQVLPGHDKIAIQKLPAKPSDVMGVVDLQNALSRIGFFPRGAADGIFGYRTQSALRLFQEYLRTMEGVAITPDGRFGPAVNQHLQRWLAEGKTPNWNQRAGEYEAWLLLLTQAKGKYAAAPSPLAAKVETFKGQSDTRKVAAWDVAGPGRIHLIGVRRGEFAGKFDDVFVLLIRGLVFKFQGTTEPGASAHPDGPPYLVPGQHAFRFGWHKAQYLALKPATKGVLVIRAGADKKLDDADLAKSLEPNPTIHIHWGGRGMARNVGSWSEGCQVIAGEVYVNPADQLIDCSRFSATTPDEARSSASKTRGAYSVLSDVAAAYAGDMDNDLVTYTLLTEEDLALAPTLAASLEDARKRVMAAMGG